MYYGVNVNLGVELYGLVDDFYNFDDYKKLILDIKDDYIIDYIAEFSLLLSLLSIINMF